MNHHSHWCFVTLFHNLLLAYFFLRSVLQRGFNQWSTHPGDFSCPRSKLELTHLRVKGIVGHINLGKVIIIVILQVCGGPDKITVLVKKMSRVTNMTILEVKGPSGTRHLVAGPLGLLFVPSALRPCDPRPPSKAHAYTLYRRATHSGVKNVTNRRTR